MAQIPITPQITGDNAPVITSAEGETGVFSLTAEKMALGVPFKQTLQELLEPQEQDPEGVLLPFAMSGEVTVAPMIASTPSLNGNMLPLSVPSDGKVLPFADQSLIAPAVSQQISDLTLKQQPILQADVVVPDVVGREIPFKLTSIVTSEDSKPLLDAMRGTEAVTQPRLDANYVQQNANTAFRSSVTLPINVPVGQPGWDKAVGESIHWMVNQNVQQAEIKLTPPHLGPIEIKISMQNDQATVTFIAAQTPTREALDASIPRLREMFGDINLNLANVDVGHRQAGESGGEAAAGGQGGVGEGQSPSAWSTEPGQSVVLSGNSLLDTYA
ncbi:MAG: flagellar hook-length control protein FliK [Candidatus Thiodiazotropha sp.]|jgi:hypothetical protein